MRRTGAMGSSGGREGVRAGPLLYGRGLAEGVLRVAVVLVVEDGVAPPPVAAEGGGAPAEPERLGGRLGATVWRWDLALPAGEEAREAVYTVGGEPFRIALPGRDRIRVAFTACNGEADEDDARIEDPERNERWRHLRETHDREPLHLLLQGGDQLYADPVWREVAGLREWERLGGAEQIRHVPTEETRGAIADFYFSRYVRLWSQPDVAWVLARVPSLMIWDDHDITDGWGSWTGRLQACPTFQALWAAAREQFAWFQLGARADDLPEGFAHRDGETFAWACRYGPVGVVAPDLRSHRTRGQVLRPADRAWLLGALEALSDREELLLVSSVPIANVNLSAIERFVGWLPGQDLYQDDLRDQWRSFAHRKEWRHVVGALFDLSERTRRRITILSGEIHLAAHGLLERGPTAIHQLISAGVAHTPPPSWAARLFGALASWQRHAKGHIDMRMIPLPEVRRRYLPARTWLGLDWRAGEGLKAAWHVEGREEPLPLDLGPGGVGGSAGAEGAEAEAEAEGGAARA